MTNSVKSANFRQTIIKAILIRYPILPSVVSLIGKCLLLFLSLSLFHHMTKTCDAHIQLYQNAYLVYPYLDDSEYIHDGGVRLDEEGSTVVTVQNDFYASAWTFFEPEAIYGVKPNHSQFLRSVIVDDTPADIVLQPTDISALQELITNNPDLICLGLRTSWNKSPDSDRWVMHNSDFMVIDSYGKCAISETLNADQIRHILEIVASDESFFVLNNDIILPDGKREQLKVSLNMLHKALDDIQNGITDSYTVTNFYTARLSAARARRTQLGYDTERKLATLLQKEGLTMFTYTQTEIEAFRTLKIFFTIGTAVILLRLGYAIIHQIKNLVRQYWTEHKSES